MSNSEFSAAKLIHRAEITANEYAKNDRTAYWPYLCGLLQSHIKDLAWEIQKLQPLEATKGLHVYQHVVNGGTWYVHYDYEAGEIGGRDTPSYGSSVSICHIWAGNCDLLEDLPEDMLFEIEEKCLIEHEESLEEDADEADIDAYIDRQYCE